MIGKVLNAPVNLYFDVTPVGRILNKFSKDLNGLETQFAWMLSATMTNFYQLIQVFIVAIFAVKWIGVALPFLLVISYLLVSRATNALKETVRLFSTTNSPILSYLGETINGTSTIRAYERQQDFINGFHKLLNDNILAS
jgi:ATP-binding cassette subfamily C (CFTR/MRP) protein 1